MPGSIELRKKRVLVVGLARTGVSTALFCAAHNAIVTATETRSQSELGDIPAKLREAGVTLELAAIPRKLSWHRTSSSPVPAFPPTIPSSSPHVPSA